MTVQTHVIATATSYAVFAWLYRKGINIPVIGTDPITVYPILGIPTAIAGSILPDVDIDNSKVSKKFPFLSPFFKHRGITHTLLFVAACYLSMPVNYSLKTKLIISAVFGFEVGNHLAGQVTFAGVVFVKGGTVYRGAVENILYGDLGEGFFVQQIHKGLADGTVGFDDAGVGIAFVFAHVCASILGLGQGILRFYVCLSNFFTNFVCLMIRGIAF